MDIPSSLLISPCSDTTAVRRSERSRDAGISGPSDLSAFCAQLLCNSRSDSAALPLALGKEAACARTSTALAVAKTTETMHMNIEPNNVG